MIKGLIFSIIKFKREFEAQLQEEARLNALIHENLEKVKLV